MPGPSYQTPSRSTFPFGRIPIVDKNGYPTQDYARYMTALEAKTNQTLSVQGNTVLNNIVQSTALTPGPTVGAGVPTLIPQMSVSITCKGNPVLIIFFAVISNDTGGMYTNCELYIDGVPQSDVKSWFTSSNANDLGMSNITHLDTPTPGNHTYAIYWAALGGTSTSAGINRSLQVIELG